MIEHALYKYTLKDEDFNFSMVVILGMEIQNYLNELVLIPKRIS